MYVNESVAADVVVQWSDAKNKLDGCKCCEQRKRFCVSDPANGGRGCACHNSGKRAECGHGCKCIDRPEACANRVLQRGLRKRLRVKQCDDRAKGWGVFAAQNIRKGDFVVEYVGELITQAEASRRSALCPDIENYLFTLMSGQGLGPLPHASVRHRRLRDPKRRALHQLLVRSQPRGQEN